MWKAKHGILNNGLQPEHFHSRFGLPTTIQGNGGGRAAAQGFLFSCAYHPEMLSGQGTKLRILNRTELNGEFNASKSLNENSCSSTSTDLEVGEEEPLSCSHPMSYSSGSALVGEESRKPKLSFSIEALIGIK